MYKKPISTGIQKQSVLPRYDGKNNKTCNKRKWNPRYLASAGNKHEYSNRPAEKKEKWNSQVNREYIQKHRDPSKIRFYVVKVESAEADEMWSYVQNKKNQVWLWHAIDHKTGDILAYTFGSWEDVVFDELFELLKVFKIQKFYTDGKKTYAKKFKHRKVKYKRNRKSKKVKRIRKIAHEIGKKNTQKIERVHLSLRTWVKRLARKTICFSKSFAMHIIVVGLCINIKFFGRRSFL